MSWVGLAVLVIVSSVVGCENGSGTATPGATVPPTTAAPPTTVALTALPIMLTDADFPSGFSHDLQLASGVYILTLTSNKPGPGPAVSIYRCGTGSGIVAGSGVVLPKGQTTAMEATKPLEAGCYQLFLSGVLSATATVKLAR